jgi:DNA-binding response OmpR family regulator
MKRSIMTHKVLIVDDDPDIRTLYKLVLRREGLEVIEAESGYEALSKVRREPPALVLLDVMMPEMDGYEVCRKLRSDPETAHLPILLISGKSTVSARRDGIMAGANDLLSKTVALQTLVSSVQTLLSNPLPS